jgi:hypothetical protein
MAEAETTDDRVRDEENRPPVDDDSMTLDEVRRRKRAGEVLSAGGASSSPQPTDELADARSAGPTDAGSEDPGPSTPVEPESGRTDLPDRPAMSPSTGRNLGPALFAGLLLLALGAVVILMSMGVL